MGERRKSVRFKAPFSIQFTNRESSQEVSGVIKDISYAGARILLDSPLDNPPSELVSLFILFPENTLKVFVRVIWMKNFGDKNELGLCFVNIPDTDKEVIYKRIFKYFKQEFTQRWWQQ